MPRVSLCPAALGTSQNWSLNPGRRVLSAVPGTSDTSGAGQWQKEGLQSHQAGGTCHWRLRPQHHQFLALQLQLIVLTHRYDCLSSLQGEVPSLGPQFFHHPHASECSVPDARKAELGLIPSPHWYLRRAGETMRQ